ncbi:bifunctional folylpolyglutamate synthase/dihydrofolate synthase [Companilactobacillus mishanensis]|uniref:bifunctional folylpolyglutamate synthase/dihydrofolate synthase n=1 Tax=Companilactobacillus mishanensis TaxID=2486008 RepID=UPI0012971DFC|nr:Mur ligase family protein [Companilactobacillus mishanensis]MQS88335.1 bifunctional folylpolyglutamate synthase/dihydrofolate synthase [Companilactobacillus mishanensis]
MIQTYDEAIKYIHSFPKMHVRNNLDNIKKVLGRLDDPQNSYPTIHVTGTNGKGTTCNYLANLIEATGKRVGVFSSPFIKVFNERIQIDHVQISNEELLDLVNEVINAAQGVDLVEFEFVTIMGFLYFRNKVDVAIIEVGIGAEHDKTNVIDPLLSIITSIDLDHEKIIGPTLKDIAIEKSGIIKKGKPIVCGKLYDSIADVIKNKSKSMNSKMFEYGNDFEITNFKINENKNQFTYVEKLVTIQDIQCRGFEKIMSVNAAIAIKAFLIYLQSSNLRADDDFIRKNIDTHHLLAREQIVREDPMIIMDGAHNIAAVDNLINSLTARWPKKAIIVLYTGMKDKDRKDILDLLSPNAKMVYVSNLDTPRSAKESDYDLMKYNNVEFISDFHSKVDQMIAEQSEDEIFVITGSFYLISELESKFNA